MTPLNPIDPSHSDRKSPLEDTVHAEDYEKNNLDDPTLAANLEGLRRRFAEARSEDEQPRVTREHQEATVEEWSSEN